MSVTKRPVAVNLPVEDTSPVNAAPARAATPETSAAARARKVFTCEAVSAEGAPVEPDTLPSRRAVAMEAIAPSDVAVAAAADALEAAAVALPLAAVALEAAAVALVLALPA